MSSAAARMSISSSRFAMSYVKLLVSRSNRMKRSATRAFDGDNAPYARRTRTWGSGRVEATLERARCASEYKRPDGARSSVTHRTRRSSAQRALAARPYPETSVRHEFCTLFDRNYLARGPVLHRGPSPRRARTSVARVLHGRGNVRIAMRLESFERRDCPLGRVGTSRPDLRSVRDTRSHVEYMWTATPAICLASFARGARARPGYLSRLPI